MDENVGREEEWEKMIDWILVFDWMLDIIELELFFTPESHPNSPSKEKKTMGERKRQTFVFEIIHESSPR